MRTIRTASITALTLTALLGTAVASQAATTPLQLSAPGMLKVIRMSDNVNMLNITWRPVTNAARYTVSIFDGVTHQAFSVSNTKTSLTLPAPGNCTQYKVTVAATDTQGVTAVTAPYIIAPLAPGAVGNMKNIRSVDGTEATITWNASNPNGSYRPASSYVMQAKELATGKVVFDATTANTQTKFGGLDPARMYSFTLTPKNEFGSCGINRSLLQGATPSAVPSIYVTRDSVTPSKTLISWAKPSWEGYSPVTGYRIGYRSPNMKTPMWINIEDPNTLSAVLDLDAQKKWNIWVQPKNDKGLGTLSKEYTLHNSSSTGRPETDSSINISEDKAGKINVEFKQPVGSNITYPKMVVNVTGATFNTGDGKDFSDTQTVFNRAGMYTFETVSCGIYTVTVTGYSAPTSTALSQSKEFGRELVNRCNTGELSADQWKLAYGRADIKGNTVNMTYGNEARVVSTLPRKSQDVVMTTDATLNSGWGYGVWFKANLNSGAAVSGYSFQYDPGYANVNASFGKALLLRVWNNGSECGTPVAKVRWPEGLSVNDKHRIMVAAQGDTLYATIDGIKMFDVPSLSQALKSSNCNMPAPSGNQVGFRTWSSTGKATFANTTVN